jgi:Fur family ferric uptake transcriptional regulator
MKNLEEAIRIFKEYLEKGELRKTPERFAILEEIYLRDDHFDVEALFISMKEKNYQVSRATVYNTLDILVECGLVTRHQFKTGQALYEKSYGYKQHDHLICLDCNHVLEFCDPRIQNIQNMAGNLLGFQVIQHSLVLYAHCNKATCERKPHNKTVNQAKA